MSVKNTTEMLMKANQLVSFLCKVLPQWPSALFPLISDYLLFTPQDHFNRLFDGKEELQDFKVKWNGSSIVAQLSYWKLPESAQTHRMYASFYKKSVVNLQDLFKRQQSFQIHLASFMLGTDYFTCESLVDTPTKDKELDRWIPAQVIAQGMEFDTSVYFERIPGGATLKVICTRSWFENRTEVEIV
jgi:hypothetical protein